MTTSNRKLMLAGVRRLSGGLEPRSQGGVQGKAGGGRGSRFLASTRFTLKIDNLLTLDLYSNIPTVIVTQKDAMTTKINCTEENRLFLINKTSMYEV